MQSVNQRVRYRARDQELNQERYQLWNQLFNPFRAKVLDRARVRGRIAQQWAQVMDELNAIT